MNKFIFILKIRSQYKGEGNAFKEVEQNFLANYLPHLKAIEFFEKLKGSDQKKKKLQKDRQYLRIKFLSVSNDNEAENHLTIKCIAASIT